MLSPKTKTSMLIELRHRTCDDDTDPSLPVYRPESSEASPVQSGLYTLYTQPRDNQPYSKCTCSPGLSSDPMDTHHPGAYPASLILSTMDHTLFTLTNILAANPTCRGVFSNAKRAHQDKQSGARGPVFPL